MTDGQLYAILSIIATLVGSLVAGIRWSAGRIGKSIDHSTQVSAAVISANTAAQVTVARELAKLSTKITRIDDFVETHTPIQGVPIVDPPGLTSFEDFDQAITNPAAVPRAQTSPEISQRVRKR